MDRITTLETELFNLCAWKPPVTTGPQTRAQRAREQMVETDKEEDLPPRGQQQRARIEEVIEENPVQQPTLETVLEHPFRNAKDVIYIPLGIKNVGAEDKNTPATAKRPEPAYKTLLPVHDSAIATNVYKQSMEAPITITQRELLSLSPEVRSQVRDNVTLQK